MGRGWLRALVPADETIIGRRRAPPVPGDREMVTHSGQGLRRKAAGAAAEVEQERARLREELLQRILAREARRQAMRRAPR